MEGKQVGSKYVGGRNIAEVAKLVRKDIRAAHPGVKCAVRIDRYSMGQSLHVVVKAAPFALFNDSYDYSPEGQALIDSLEAIGNDYNRQDIDSQSDYFNVDYFLHVGVCSSVEQAQKEAA